MKRALLIVTAPLSLLVIVVAACMALDGCGASNTTLVQARTELNTVSADVNKLGAVVAKICAEPPQIIVAECSDAGPAYDELGAVINAAQSVLTSMGAPVTAQPTAAVTP